eukprot:m.108759 g.108759  ORF g.108759 m.108759 type:complete len:348 (-) comp51751_c0_seq2:49-1092(-)
MSGEGIRRRFVEFDGSSRAQTASTLSRNASTEPLEALLALGSDPTCSENPQILQELGLEEKDIPVLLDMVIDSELDTIGDGWTRVHAIHVLTHFTDVPVGGLRAVIALLDSENEWLQYGALGLLARPAMRMDLSVLLSDTTTTVLRRIRAANALTLIGVENEADWKAVKDSFLAILNAKSGDSHFNGYILGDLMRLHGMDSTKLDDEDWEGPKHVPDTKTRDVVRTCFRRGLCEPGIAGGYIDFLESGFIPVDPDDDMAKSFEANYSESEISTEMPLEQLRKLHEERLQALAEHWKFLRATQRSQQLSKSINKALVLVVILFIFQWFNSAYGPLSAENLRRHHEMLQ